jgi:ORF6N domain
MTELILSEDYLATSIYIVRGQKVLLDRDLALMYGIETKRLKEAVRRNSLRFPIDFMFELSDEEFQNWRTQFATSNSDKLGLRYAPMAFTEQGVAMLSSVVNSPRAIEVNIAIMRTFVKMRHFIRENQELAQKLDAFEDILEKHGIAISTLFEAFEQLSSLKEDPPRVLIGFKKNHSEE